MILTYRPEALARRLEYDEDAEHYRLDDGQVFRVSDVVDTWRRVCGREKPAFTDFHRDRGHALHAAIEADILGRLDELELPSEMWAEVEPRLAANRAWRKLVGFEVLHVRDPETGFELSAVELRMWHPTGVAGTADCLAMVMGKVAVVDWKHSYVEGARVQTAGYRKLAQFTFEGLAIERRFVLKHEIRANENGSADTGTFSPVPYDDHVSDERTFAGCLWLLNEAARRRELQKEIE